MNTSLTDFIAHARKKGMDHQTIRMLLLSSGWKEKDIAHALTEEALDMPVPVPTDSGGARDAFFHLLTFVSFYTVTISLVILFFTYINRLFPDAAFGDYYQSNFDLSGIRWSLAAVIVAFPLYLMLTRFLLREMREHAEKAWSGVRRWLTYLTLFVAASALMGDVITLVFRLLEGELTVRFMLKVLIVLLIAGLSFAYYFLSLKMPVEKTETRTMHRLFAGVGIAVSLIAVVWGIWLAGSPMAERERKFDDRRIEDFRAIQSEISRITLGKTYGTIPDDWRMENPIPATLEDVSSQAQMQKVDIVDPETGDPYAYTVLGQSTYELCAEFNAIRDEQYDILWNHEAGHQCFTIDVLTPEGVLKPAPVR